MPQRLRTTAIALILLAGTAQAQHALHCRDLNPEAAEDAYRAFECVSKLNGDLEEALTRIDTLEENLRRIDALLKKVQPVPAVGDHAATRAIVAYYSDKGEKRCPDGWSPYEEAKDRFILGAGGEVTTVGDTGGEPEVTLTEAQMPAHTHAFGFWFSDADGDDATFDRDEAPRFRSGLNTNNRWTASTTRTPVAAAGGDQPHNNMPPYIALYFCVADG